MISRSPSAGPLQAAIRIGAGLYWLYFASRAWNGVAWMQPLMVQSAVQNPIPGLHELLLQVVVPHWFGFALAFAVAQTLVGLLLLLGLLCRWAAWVGVLLALCLALTVGFLEPELGRRWLFYLAVLVNLACVVGGPGALAGERLRGVPRWLRS
ncbi:MAG: hypothetical protein JF888_06730 [Candidatus Dormibacteraeota bacterium]|uniref:DoxX family membrane protein n=1 Tax=Candidatus Dormiibacter inghamiae TaxID=3127013 RepID=A0A934KAB5_9BACT|nr:hypothetical protein [Candidatus Dormibacteraeota bacterium]MBJ7606681.1 hypothetical protein [Candidatus Dormibacteraeota bacterium]